MSSNHPAIAVRGLSKSYTIRRNQTKHTTLVDALEDCIKHPFRRAEKELFWALRDLNFEVAPGEIVGIIGRNGAGKSTLLKILSRITRPTSGEVELRGRVGSLLEVGTGFHQELTGRENIFLSGTILGMKRREITERFDAIVDFAGVERFLDTPVKRYSSGMYVRLAFAVAAHLEPEILIVDEVLAVGDATFQKKCLSKMGEVAKGGRTVLFVSHNINAISVLCSSCIVLAAGRIVANGEVSRGIEAYLSNTRQTGHRKVSGVRTTPEWSIVGVNIRTPMVEPNSVITIDVHLAKEQTNPSTAYVSLHVVNIEGVTIIQCDSRLSGFWLKPDRLEVVARVRIDGLWLKPGPYTVDLFVVSSGAIVDRHESAGEFEVSPKLPYPHAASADAVAAGVVLSDFNWSEGGGAL